MRGRMPTRLVFISLVLAACGAPLAPDGPHDADRPSMIRISGTVAFHGAASGAPASGIAVAANRLDDDSQMGSTQTDSAGDFALDLPTTSGYGDIYLEATNAAYVTTYYNFQSILVGDALGVALDVFSPDAYAALYTTAGVTDRAGAGVIEVQAGAYGATINPPPMQTVLYDNASGAPDATATSTSSDGVAYILDAQTQSIDLLFDYTYTPVASRELRVFSGALTIASLSRPYGPEL